MKNKMTPNSGVLYRILIIVKLLAPNLKPSVLLLLFFTLWILKRRSVSLHDVIH